MDPGAPAVTDRYDIDADRGFLPGVDPLAAFDLDAHPPDDARYLSSLDRLGESLPERLAADSLRSAVEGLERPPAGLVERLSDRAAIRLCKLAGMLASGYVHQQGATPADRLPAGIAIALHRTSERFGRKPILSYDGLCLHNFERLDPTADAPFAVENLRALERFSPLADEHWFVAIHVAIEAAAGPALVACGDAQRAVTADDPDGVARALATIAASLERQTAIMERMTEGNAPEAFVTGFRPYYEGFDGVVFEGVEALAGEPQTLRGGSGAQSSALPSIDAALGVDHAATILVEKLQDMRSYMPTWHREVIRAFEAGPDVRDYVEDVDDADLTEAYNRCIRGLGAFREVHFSQVAQYIAEMGETTGTGGTDYLTFLPKMKRETEDQQL